MTKILVVYGTGEGHTAHVAQALAARLRERGASTYIADLEEESPDLRLRRRGHRRFGARREVPTGSAGVRQGGGRIG